MRLASGTDQTDGGLVSSVRAVPLSLSICRRLTGCIFMLPVYECVMKGLLEIGHRIEEHIYLLNSLPHLVRKMTNKA
jgi:hypothetical protein